MRLNRLTLLASLIFGCILVSGGCARNDSCCAGGCDKAQCKAVKPGVITTANKMCVVEVEDPVNPAVEPVIWRGQKYGLCCKGCIPKWNAMTDAQKDAGVAKALAASK